MIPIYKTVENHAILHICVATKSRAMPVCAVQNGRAVLTRLEFGAECWPAAAIVVYNSLFLPDPRHVWPPWLHPFFLSVPAYFSSSKWPASLLTSCEDMPRAVSPEFSAVSPSAESPPASALAPWPVSRTCQ